jgi:hypothetical protein
MPLAKFFKLDVLGRKGFSLGRRQNGSLNHVLLGRKGLSCAKEQLLSRSKFKKTQGENFVQIKHSLYIGKLLKHRYLK